MKNIIDKFYTFKKKYRLYPKHFLWKWVYKAIRILEELSMVLIVGHCIVSSLIIYNDLDATMVERQQYVTTWVALIAILLAVTIVLRILYLKIGYKYYQSYDQYDRRYLVGMRHDLSKEELNALLGRHQVEYFIKPGDITIEEEYNPITYDELKDLGFTAVANELKKEGWFNE